MSPYKLIALLLATIALTALPVLSQSTSISVVVEVYVDGSAKITYNVTVSQPPIQLTLPLLGQPFYAEAWSDNESIPVEYNDTSITFTATGDNTIIVYYTSNLTSKKGDEWTLKIHSPWRITVILPPEALVYDVQPQEFEPTVVNGKVGFTFNPGDIEIKYIIVPTPIKTSTTTPTTIHGNITQTSGDTWLLVAKTLILAAVVVAIFLFVKRIRGKKTSQLEELDERDKKIIETLIREGELTAQELIEKTKIPKTPLYRRLKKLVSQGYLETVNRGGKTYYRVRKPR